MEQQTSDNLIVKDNCFIIEIFDRFVFSGVLRKLMFKVVRNKKFQNFPSW